jgi:pyruvate/2-oxoacid:ferredoxin oxidoreductase beta subunit
LQGEKQPPPPHFPPAGDVTIIHLFAPCPTGWRFPSEESIAIGRLAVETNFSPLFEVVDARFKFTFKNRLPLPVETDTRRIGKYRHLDLDELREFQKTADERYRRLLAMTTLSL